MSPTLNLLLIAIDDLNDMISPMGGHPDTVTPNFGRLTNKAVVFKSAHAVVPSCAGSRTAMFGGQAPWKGQGAGRAAGVYNNQGKFSDVYPLGQRLSFIGRLRNKGYVTRAAGKLLHSETDLNDWDFVVDEPADDFQPMSQAVLNGLPKSFDAGVVPSGYGPLIDEIQVDTIIQDMQANSEGKVWAFGSHRPHSPWIVPRAYWNMIPNSPTMPPEIRNGVFDPYDDSCLAGLPPEAFGVINPNRKVPKAFFDTGEYLSVYVRGYLAAIAYLDTLLGRVLDRLDETGLWSNTIVVVVSDNGEQLGYNQSGRKFAPWSRATLVPFMIAVPGLAPRMVSRPVSLLDLYPTLAELMDFTPPHQLDGVSLVPVLTGEKPMHSVISAWGFKNDPDKIVTTVSKRIGDRTWKLIRYNWNTHPVELYDRTNDYFEHTNLVVNPDIETQAVIGELSALLPDALPPPILGSDNE